jgi:tellurite methyltransferase
MTRNDTGDDAGDDTWAAYYRETQSRPPRATVLFALDRFDAEDGTRARFAVDLGCGAGRDTVEILRRGWRVLAIDAQQDAIDQLTERVGGLPGAAERLDCRVQSFAAPDLAVPRADLVNASFTLPGCPPDRFPALWATIAGALPPGGRFAGQLYGDRDSWTTKHPDMTFLSRADAERLLTGFEAEMFEEEETDSVTPRGEAKHWHIFHIVSRKT